MNVTLGIVAALGLLSSGCSAPTDAECAGGPCEVSHILGDATGKSDAVAPSAWLWPNGDIFLIVDRSEVGWWSGIWTDRALEGAADELAENTAVRIRLIDDPSQSTHGHYVRLTSQPDGGGSANYGTRGTEAESSAWATRHEVGHVLGLSHTHARGDRDEHLVVHWDWIEEGKEHIFRQRSSWEHIGPYDVTSVMQYSSFAFSTENPEGDDCATLTAVSVEADPAGCTTLGFLGALGFGSFITSESGYSDWDYTVIASLYCDARFCGDNCASEERCSASRVQANLARLTDWEASTDGRTWRERYPELAPR